MSTDALTRHDLDAAITTLGGGLEMHPRCHPQSGVEVWYRDGVLWFRCQQCLIVFTRVAVADGPKVTLQ